MSIYHYTEKGQYAEVEINRNAIFSGASNANSRTLRVKIRNTDTSSHTYYLVLKHELLWYVVKSVTLNPGDIAEVKLDLAEGSSEQPNYTLKGPGLHIFVDTDNQNPDVYIFIWTLDVNLDRDRIAQINFNKLAKYSMYGGVIITWEGKQIMANYFFIYDMGEIDYIPIKMYFGPVNTGLIIAINPFDREAAVVDIRNIVSTFDPNEFNQYIIKLAPVPTGYIKVSADIVVDYNALGNWLGSAFAWLTALGTDLVAVFLRNKDIQYLVLSKIDPLATRLLGVQNVTIDAYQDQNDPTKVHIIVTTFYNVLDDPGLPLAVIIGILIVLAIWGVAAITWGVAAIKEADVKKFQTEKSYELTIKCIERLSDPNLSMENKQLIAEVCGRGFNAVSQTTGVPSCDGPVINGKCVRWTTVTAIAVAATLVLALLVLRK